MPAGLGSAADRALEEAIKNSVKRNLAPKVEQPNPFARCLQCLHTPAKEQADTKTFEERRSLRHSRRGSARYGHGGERIDRSLVLENYKATDLGTQGTLEWRRFLLDEDGKQLSYWHDVPLMASPTTLHAFVEIPKHTKAKYEVCPTESTNPIKQDVKKGEPRYYNIDIQWNYGAFPQTWEQPDHTWSGLEGYAGDDDPVDIVDISSTPVAPGSIIVCKPLAALAMIDEGEVDWKVIVINVADPKAMLVNTKEDADKYFPGEIDAIRDWFTWYKATDPKTGERDPSKKNVFGFDGRALDTTKAWEVVREAHGTWADLVTRQVKAGGRKLA